ncbi:unnamed protein product [Euphydryas editha]|nr:unnamed protein product [Euphydryas editha]
MDSIPETSLLQFSSDTLQYIRKQRGLDNVENLKDSLNNLHEWIQKQEHFKKKDYPKEYLERFIIRSNGSIEIAKKKIDILCTFKTKLPKYFEPFDMDNSYILKIM